jgi:PAS domain S-box-containing protein
MVCLDTHLARIREILREHPHGMSVTEIARLLQKNKHSVGRYLDVLRASGVVEMRSYGMAKVFTLTKRMPISEMLSIAEEAILILDHERRVIEANDAALVLLQLERERVSGHRLEHLPVPDPRIHDLIQHLDAAAMGREPCDEVHIEGEDERYYWCRVIPMVFEQGERGTTLILGDMTEHRQAEEAVAASEALFRGLAENVQDGVLIYRDRELVFANRRAFDIFGYPEDELARLDPAEVLAPEERSRVGTLNEAHLRDPTRPREFKAWIRRKDGEDRYLFARMSAIEHGNVVTRYVVVTDMTDARRAEEALHNQYAFLRYFLDEFPNPLYAIDQSGTFVEVNGAFTDAIGRDRSEVLGASVEEVIAPEYHEAFTATDRELFSNQGERIYCTTLALGDRAPYHVLVRKSTIRPSEAEAPILIGVLLSQPNLFP